MKPIRYLLLTLPFLGAFSAYPIKAIPATFTRVVLEKEGKLWKTIDLIGDVHTHDPYIPSIDPNDPDEQYLSEDDKTYFSMPTDRALLNALYHLDKHSAEPIDLLWELTPTENQGDEFYLQSINRNNKSLLFGIGTEQFCKKIFTKNISFIAADCWRNHHLRNLMEWGLCQKDFLQNVELCFNTISKSIELRKDTESYAKDKEFLKIYKAWFMQPLHGDISDLFHHIEDHFTGKSNAEDLLALVKQHQDEKTYTTVKAIYDSFKEWVLTPLHNELAHIKQDPLFKDKNAYDILQEPTIHTKMHKLADLHTYKEHSLYLRLMDYELLLKLFASTAKHSIIFAGDAHCRALLNNLLTNFDGKIVFQFGVKDLKSIKHLGREKILDLYLNKQVWQYLQESPQTSFVRGQLLQAIDMPEILHQVTNLEGLSPELLCERLAAIDNAKQSSYLLGLEAFINLHAPEALLAMVKNDNVDAVKLLLRYGVNPNIKDSYVCTPLHLAVQQKNVMMLVPLIVYGADINAQQDGTLNTPLHIAWELVATNKGGAAVMKYLLHKGAVKTIKNANGQTVEDQIRNFGKTEKHN